MSNEDLNIFRTLSVRFDPDLDHKVYTLKPDQEFL